MQAIKVLNAFLSFTIELLMLFALGFCGYHVTGGTFIKWVVAIGLPLSTTILWGALAAPKSKSRLTYPYLLCFKLSIFFATALLIFLAINWRAAAIFAAVAIVNELVAFKLKT
jgi:hypothetical protein